MESFGVQHISRQQRTLLLAIILAGVLEIPFILYTAATGKTGLAAGQIAVFAGLVATAASIVRQIRAGKAATKSREFYTIVSVGAMIGFLLVPVVGLALVLSHPAAAGIVLPVSVVLGATVFLYSFRKARQGEK